MSCANEITIDGRRYIAADSLKKVEPKIGDGGVRIVIGQRGFVWIGHFYQNGDECRIENAANVRRWGTKLGLGELAKNGATTATVLDDCDVVRLHALAVIATIDCDQSKWASRV